MARADAHTQLPASSIALSARPDISKPVLFCPLRIGGPQMRRAHGPTAAGSQWRCVEGAHAPRQARAPHCSPHSRGETRLCALAARPARPRSTACAVLVASHNLLEAVDRASAVRAIRPSNPPSHRQHTSLAHPPSPQLRPWQLAPGCMRLKCLDEPLKC